MLVVEADADLGAMLVDVLPGEGYAASLVVSAERASREMDARTFDVVLVELPWHDRGDTLALAARLRTAARAPVLLARIPFSSAAIAADARTTAIVECIRKPFGASELIAMLERAARQPGGTPSLRPARATRGPSDSAAPGEPWRASPRHDRHARSWVGGVGPLRRDDLERARRTPIEERARQTLEVMASGIRLQRVALERRHPDASAADLERRLRAWLARER